MKPRPDVMNLFPDLGLELETSNVIPKNEKKKNSHVRLILK